MVPLLGIAFVVAIISTGVFYGLFAGRLKSSAGDVPEHPVVVAARDLARGTVLEAHDLQLSTVKGGLSGSFSKSDQAVGATLLASLKQNEPLLEDRVLPKDPETGQPRNGVPKGMRAISMRVSDSEGLISLLRPGARVDVQAVLDRNGAVQLRTMLQNVELLALNPQTATMQGVAGPIFNVTVLTDPAASDLAALSDSGAHVRIALRNPFDSDTAPRRALGLAAAFQSSGGERNPDERNKITRQVALPGTPERSGDPGLEIRVEVLDASKAAIEELNSSLAGARSSGPNSTDALRVDAFASAAAAGELVGRLAAKHEVEIVSARTLEAGLGVSVSYRAGSGSSRLRVEFVPQTGERGKTKLRVAPEISLQTADGTGTSRYQADLPAQGSFLIKGIPDGGAALEKIYPGRSWANRTLAIFVTAGTAKPTRAALAQSSRGR